MLTVRHHDSGDAQVDGKSNEDWRDCDGNKVSAHWLSDLGALQDVRNNRYMHLQQEPIGIPWIVVKHNPRSITEYFQYQADNHGSHVAPSPILHTKIGIWNDEGPEEYY